MSDTNDNEPEGLTRRVFFVGSGAGVLLVGCGGGSGDEVPAAESTEKALAVSPGSVSSIYNFTNAIGPFTPAQTNGGVTAQKFFVHGSGATYKQNYLRLPKNIFLNAGQLGITLATTGAANTTQTPTSMTLGWTGILPTSEAVLCDLYHYNQARFSLFSHSQSGRLRGVLERNGTSVMLESVGGLSMTAKEAVGIRYDDDPAGPGGTVTFMRNGVAFGAPQPISMKLRVTPECELQCNASLGNTTNSAAQRLSRISIDLTVAAVPPPPPPPNPNALTVYGDPGTRFALNLDSAGTSGNYVLTIPAGLALVQRVVTPTPAIKASGYTMNALAAAYGPTQSNGGVTTGTLAVVGSGASYANNQLNLATGTYLSAGAIGLSLPTTSEPATTQAPRSLTLKFVGVLPQTSTPLVSLYDYSKGRMELSSHWQAGCIAVSLERDGQSVGFVSISGLSNTTQEDVAVRYDDNIGGVGGTITFLRNGAAFGPPQTVAFKPRITPNAIFESNASLGNTANSGDLKIASISLALTVLSDVESFIPVVSGTISAAGLNQLYVNALSVSTPQAAVAVSYGLAAGGATSTVNVVVGPIDVPAGIAYRAVLENWSTGVAVSHANALVMTLAVRQNCQFEDTSLAANQGRWMECLPQGPVPNIGGIAYYCEAIRIGTYVQFQFGYDWSAATMPDNPFGDPTGKESYMVPHKWRIEDKNGAVLAIVQRPDGGPLNGTDIPAIFEGSYDGYGRAITNATDKWYPRGTVRAAVIWRSATPPAYDQAFISANLPRYDVTVGYASHTDYSNNGFDSRLWGGDSTNGFGNTRVMPYEPTNHATLTPQAGMTADPWKALYTPNSMAAVASTWLRYTPFNQSGRSPITGPGGVRDDRAAFAEPVGQYMYNVSANRPHDGKAWATIALDYLTGYASDPYHSFEAGRCVPLFKGGNATRDIGLRNHYYGYGEGSRPANRSWYIQGGRPYEMADDYSPWASKVPYGGTAPRKPIFGTNQIDLPHAHQFPHWGSMLWKTPEFAFLGHKLSDQARLYENVILGGSSYDAGAFGERARAWQFLHCVMVWKTASRMSDKLYSRSEILDFVVKDFEIFSNSHKTTTPGFDNPPTNLLVNGELAPSYAIYAATQRFGVCNWSGDAVVQADFQVGYWLTALAIGERIGFNAAVRAASAKAGAVLDWLIAQHRKRIVGRINSAPRTNLGADSPFTFYIWRAEPIAAAGGNVAALAQNYTELGVQNGMAPTWDVYQYAGATYTKDGQAMDQLMAGPSVLKLQLGQSGGDLDTAIATAAGWRNQKKAEQEALGANAAGTTWFKYLQAVNNPALS